MFAGNRLGRSDGNRVDEKLKGTDVAHGLPGSVPLQMELKPLQNCARARC